LETGIVPMGNMEAIQFHPTGTVPTDILVTEGCRGDGGTLLDVNEYRFMPDYEPEKAELASRDVVSRRMTEHMRKGLGVKSPYGDHLWLDIRHLGEKHITTNLREVYDICNNFLGVNPLHQLIPVRPTHHYSMGGVRTNKDGAAYGLSGLFSAGEASCWDMHGFNRLGGNSLAETVVAGSVVGRKIVEFLQGETTSFFSSQALKEAAAKVQGRIDALVSRSKGNENCFVLRDAMQDVMMDHVGIFRNGRDLAEGVEKLQKLLERSEHVGLQAGNVGFSPELSMALRVPGMIKLALCTAYGALQRTESRGAHAREDFPERNDRDWLNRTLATWKEGESLPVLTYEEVSPWFEIPPGERGYGGGKIISADIPQNKIKPFGSEGKGI
ncbi:MAG: FAD-binding protein, partial [Betaproteobacteria bacterium]|nr:FAD-binding protein [Betaproteobacteria bacterium]